jgi:predicted RNA binding protein YcfA (HicA-like mRNA interferase family)
VAEHLGFELKMVSGSHWQFKKNGVGKVTIPRYADLRGDLLSSICRQMKIKRKEFFRMLGKI